MNRSICAKIAAVCFAASALLGECQGQILARWVELGADGSASVRVITEDACPSVVFDGTPVAMSTRSDPADKLDNVKPATFPVRGCEVLVPPDASSAVLDARPLPLPRPNPQRIVVLGDTGCRLAGAAIQDCNDPQSWPFATIAASAAAARPDLVIHVGDYHYRESGCPVGRGGCSGSPSGYGWDAWNADFFAPAAPLLDAAPLVLVRGNHEDCDRAGEGWFRFLDRMPMPQACRDLSGIFVARLGNFGLVVVDGAKAEDPKGDAGALANTLRQQLVEVLARIPAEAWFVTHRPLDAMRAANKAEQGNIVGNKGEQGNGTDNKGQQGSGVNNRKQGNVVDNKGEQENVVDNKVQELAFGSSIPAAVTMLVAGHIHFFQAIDFGGIRPPQLVVGTGGDTLAPIPPLSLVGADINGAQVKNSATYSGFGYMVWDRSGSSWAGTLFDTAGKPLQHCRLAGRSLACGG